jgi:hypothetical protein
MSHSSGEVDEVDLLVIGGGQGGEIVGDGPGEGRLGGRHGRA